MKTKQHKVGLIAKKCVDLKLKNGFDAFFDYSPHVQIVEVTVYRNWDIDSNNHMYRGSASLTGSWNSSKHSTSLDEIIESLDSLSTGLGVE